MKLGHILRVMSALSIGLVVCWVLFRWLLVWRTDWWKSDRWRLQLFKAVRQSKTGVVLRLLHRTQRHTFPLRICVDIHDNTLLHLAAMSGNTGIAKLLFQSELDDIEHPERKIWIGEKNKLGKTAAELADEFGHAQLAALIRAEYGRRIEKYNTHVLEAVHRHQEVLEEMKKDVAECTERFATMGLKPPLVTCPRCNFVQISGERSESRAWYCISCGKNLGYDYGMGM